MASRRAFVAGVASAVASGLAGCLVGASPRAARLDAFAGRAGTTGPGASEGATTSTYRWSHDDTAYDLDVAVPEALLGYGRARPRVRNRGVYVADPHHDRLLETVADALASQADGGHDATSVARTFVQRIPYETDRESTGTASYPRYPVETLVARRADCEDAAVLLAGLLERLGHDTALLAFWEANHMALGLASDDPGDGPTYRDGGTAYAYLETAAPGWDVGEVPDLVGTEQPEVMHVDGHATLVTDWATELVGRGLRARTAVRNAGDAPARNVTVRLALVTPEREAVATGEATVGAIEPGDESAVAVRARAPAARIDRARIEVVEDTAVVDDAVLSRSGDPDPPARDTGGAGPGLDR